MYAYDWPRSSDHQGVLWTFFFPFFSIFSTHYGQGPNSYSSTLCPHLAAIIHSCEHHDYFILIPCSPVPKLSCAPGSRPLCSWLPSPRFWPRQTLLFFTLIQIIPRNTVTWSRNFRVFVTHTLSKSVRRLTLIDAELMIRARRVHAAVCAAEDHLPPRGLHGEPYELEWHVYHCFTFISKQCSRFLQQAEGE